MTLLSYQIFKTVAEAGSFHKAADILGLTPSAISHAIATLEKELGFSVLIRSKAGVSLTSHGEHIMPYVSAILASDESLRQVVSEFNGLTRGKVRIGSFSSACIAFVRPLIKAFGELYPAIDIEVYEGTYAEVSAWIKNGTVDFGFLSSSSAGDIPIEIFYRDPLLAITPADFRKEGEVPDGKLPGLTDGEAPRPGQAAELPCLTAAEMKDWPFVVQRGPTDADVQNFLKENGLAVRSLYHVVDDLSTVALVASGFGLGIMPELTMQDIPYPIHRFRLQPASYRMIGLAALNRERMAPAVRTMYRYILDHYGNMDA